MSPRVFLSSIVIRGLGVWVAARLGVAVLGVLAELPHPTHFHPLASVLLLGPVVGATWIDLARRNLDLLLPNLGVPTLYPLIAASLLPAVGELALAGLAP